MDILKLPKLVKRASKRLGRGIGSGKGGHTSSRGNKGQKARGKVAINFEGTKFKKSLIKRLPLLRGKGRFKPWGEVVEIVNLKSLAEWPEKTEVTIANLVKKGLVSTKATKVKILGTSKLKNALTIKVSVSSGVAEIVTKAGGKIV